MHQHLSPRCVLVPVLDGDITAAALALATAAVAGRDVRVAIVHVACAGATVAARRSGARAGMHGDPCSRVPRWRRLAALLPPERVFVDAASGEPAAVILTQARRFGCDTIVLGRPAWSPAHAAPLDRLAARLLHGAPGRVLLAVDGDAAPRGAALPRARGGTSTLPHPSRSHHALASRTSRPEHPACPEPATVR